MVDGHPPTTSSRALLVIAGSGRSGTSLMAGLCGRLGFAIPQPELKANDTNPRGFGEPRWAVAFHKRLMESWSISHDDGRPDVWALVERAPGRQEVGDELRAWLQEQFDQSDRVVVKDPRLAWFLDLYAEAARDLDARFGVIMMLRHPGETIRSKQIAYGDRIDTTTRAAGWLNLMLGTEFRSRGMRRALIRYDDLLTDWRSMLERAEMHLGIDLVSQASEEQIAAADDLVDPSLRRSQWTWEELDLAVFVRDLVEASYNALSGLAGENANPASPAVVAAMNEARTAHEATYLAAEALVRSSLTAAKKDLRRKLTAQAKRKLRAQSHEQGKLTDAPNSNVGRQVAGGGQQPSVNTVRRRVGRWLGRRR